MPEDSVSVMDEERARFLEQETRGQAIDVALLQSGCHKAGSAFDTEKGTGVFRISGPKADRVRDIVVSEGMNNKAFRKNPVFLWAHDDSIPPIGKSLNEEIIPGDGVYAETEFDLKNDPSGFTRTIFGKYVDGVLNAVSIRFLPMSWERILEPNDKGETAWNGGYKFITWELLEYSAVPIPAYREALALAADGIIRLTKRLGHRAAAATPNTSGAGRWGYTPIAAALVAEFGIEYWRRAMAELHPTSAPAERGAWSEPAAFDFDLEAALGDLQGLHETLKTWPQP